MSLKTLPKIKGLQEPQGYSWDVPSDVLARWSETVASESTDPQTITIYEPIGFDPWDGSGFTARRMSAALRSIGAKDVTVKINSPGGSVFEGFAIYNELAAHPAKVTVEVMGIAASAAAYIAMAGDEVNMGLGSFLMVHNAWGIVVGNRNDMAESITVLQKIDNAQIDIFEARTGLKRTDIETLMDGETFLTARDAVSKGFADGVFNAPEAESKAQVRPEIAAKNKLDALLAQSGVPRSERRRMLKEATGGKQDAAPTVTHDAGHEAAALEQLLATLRS